MTTNARDVARRILSRVDEGAYATLALSGELDRAALSPQDRALTTELIYGVLRWRTRLDAALASYAPRGLDGLDKHTRNVLRLAALQIMLMRIPAHAAVDDAVEACKRGRTQKLAGFVNAVLRKLAGGGEPQHVPRAARLSAPEWLIALVDRQLGKPDADRFFAAINQPPPLWLRINRQRTTPAALAERLRSERASVDELLTDPRAPHAIAASGIGDPARLPAFVEGLVTPQDLAAQLVVELAAPEAGERALDVCAGVGGKTLDLAERGLTVVAVDQAARKLDLLRDAARRLGVGDAVTPVVRDARELGGDPATYDLVLVDAPCSGLGVLRRHPEAKWRPAPDVAPLVELQRQILDAAVARVRPGGRLVYSVCSFLPEEGEAHMEAVLAANPSLRLDKSLRTWPHDDGADAFYAAVLCRA